MSHLLDSSTSKCMESSSCSPAAVEPHLFESYPSHPNTIDLISMNPILSHPQTNNNRRKPVLSRRCVMFVYLQCLPQHGISCNRRHYVIVFLFPPFRHGCECRTPTLTRRGVQTEGLFGHILFLGLPLVRPEFILATHHVCNKATPLRGLAHRHTSKSLPV